MRVIETQTDGVVMGTHSFSANSSISRPSTTTPKSQDIRGRGQLLGKVSRVHHFSPITCCYFQEGKQNRIELFTTMEKPKVPTHQGLKLLDVPATSPSGSTVPEVSDSAVPLPLDDALGLPWLQN